MSVRRYKDQWTCLQVRGAIGRQQMVLHLQPQISFRTGRIEAIEALARWRRADGDLVGPGRFLPAVRAGGFARRFDSWALRAAVAEASALHAEGHELRVAVNIEACSLADPRLVSEIAGLLERSGLAPPTLEIEVTERTLELAPRASHTLAELASLGVGTALDDFGVGFSSLTRVASLPFSTLKLDRSLVAGIDRHPRAATVFGAAVRLAHDLGLTVVAEGVETMRVWTQSAKLGADLVQGWLVDRPLPHDDLTARLGTVASRLTWRDLAGGDAGGAASRGAAA